MTTTRRDFIVGTGAAIAATHLPAQSFGAGADEPVLVRERDIRGYIAMLMDLPSLAALQVLLREFIERSAGVAIDDAKA